MATTNYPVPSVYCLMITGKNKERLLLSRISMLNFVLQTYPEKYLIIINEGKVSVFNDTIRRTMPPTILDYISEVHVNRRGTTLTLGDMRNISLEMVPPDAIWTIWDDDDWRRSDYLSLLYKQLSSQSGARYLLFQNRLEYNFNTKLAWKMMMKNGTQIVFAYKDPLLKYDALNVNEDVVVKKYIHAMAVSKEGSVVLFNNDPRIYLRFVHTNNTSIYVEKNKTSIRKPKKKNANVVEMDANEQDIEYIDDVLKKYYWSKN